MDKSSGPIREPLRLSLLLVRSSGPITSFNSAPKKSSNTVFEVCSGSFASNGSRQPGCPAAGVWRGVINGCDRGGWKDGSHYLRVVGTRTELSILNENATNMARFKDEDHSASREFKNSLIQRNCSHLVQRKERAHCPRVRKGDLHQWHRRPSDSGNLETSRNEFMVNARPLPLLFEHAVV